MKDFLTEKFSGIYHSSPERFFFAPARVNLIGEHIDYNGGLVMPCALKTGTYLAIKPIAEPILKFSSLNFQGENAEILLQKEGYTKSGNSWFNYPLGIINEFIRNRKTISGLEMLFYGNIPNGGGLSSSASIEVVTAFALNKIFEADFSTLELVKLSQKVENQFIGVNCGIMDQFAIGMGKENHAMVLNCQTLDCDYIPAVFEDETLLIINTNKQRTLADSKYNERRATCEAALEILNEKENFKDLCSVPVEFFEENKELLTDEMRQRVKHVILENERVKNSAKALSENDIETFGQLMNASHQSLMDDYEVTGKELDTVFLESLKFDGVVGCRMTGAGFGGCAIVLVKNEKVDLYKKYITEKYNEIIGYEPSVYETAIGDGVKEI